MNSQNLYNQYLNQLQQESPETNYKTQSSTNPREKSPDLDHFIHSRSRILNTKLEILSAEIFTRFRIRDNNKSAIQKDRELLKKLLHPYHFPDFTRIPILHQKLIDLNTEQRDQDIRCFQDLVPVIRDFLTVWEAFEQTKSKARLLKGIENV